VNSRRTIQNAAIAAVIVAGVNADIGAAVIVAGVNADIGAAAFAADMPSRGAVYTKAPVVPPYNWTGFYVGGTVGGLWNSQTAHWDPLPSPPAFGANAIMSDLKAGSFVGGVHGGYNWQFANSWVAGIEADWSWSGANVSATTPWTFFVSNNLVGPGVETTLSSKLNWLATARGRIGYLVTPQALVYVTGGAAWGGFDYSASAVYVNNDYTAASSFSSTKTGYVVGGGVEYALWSNWLLRWEYQFYRLQGASITAASTAFPALPSGFRWDNSDTHVVRAGVSYKFGN
jgi:outer membrane immunogenic protein